MARESFFQFFSGAGQTKDKGAGWHEVMSLDSCSCFSSSALSFVSLHFYGVEVVFPSFFATRKPQRQVLLSRLDVCLDVGVGRKERRMRQALSLSRKNKSLDRLNKLWILWLAPISRSLERSNLFM